MAYNNKELPFQVGEKILCYHGPMIYEAKILKAEVFQEKHPDSSETGPHYLIHYKGWKSTWDEWVVESRVLKFNEANLSKQKQLKETFAQTKHKNSITVKKPVQEAPPTEKGKKRKREIPFDKNDLIKRQKLALFDIPEPLGALLVQDWENINKSRLLVPLPRQPTVTDIIGDYKNKLQENDGKVGDEVAEILDGVKLYFNKSLGCRLLYQDERQQYFDVRTMFNTTDYTSIYGAEHLLRLFAIFPEIFTKTLLNEDVVGSLKEHIVDFLNFINENREDYFVDKYEKL